MVDDSWNVIGKRFADRWTVSGMMVGNSLTVSGKMDGDNWTCLMERWLVIARQLVERRLVYR